MHIALKAQSRRTRIELQVKIGTRMGEVPGTDQPATSTAVAPARALAAGRRTATPAAACAALEAETTATWLRGPSRREAARTWRAAISRGCAPVPLGAASIAGAECRPVAPLGSGPWAGRAPEFAARGRRGAFASAWPSTFVTAPTLFRPAGPAVAVGLRKRARWSALEAAAISCKAPGRGLVEAAPRRALILAAIPVIWLVAPRKRWAVPTRFPVAARRAAGMRLRTEGALFAARSSGRIGAGPAPERALLAAIRAGAFVAWLPA
jgi:hypothetical protein